MNPLLITALFLLGIALLAVMAGIFYSNGRADMYQEQREKLRQRQALGEIVIDRHDILKFEHSVIRHKEFGAPMEFIAKDVAMKIGLALLPHMTTTVEKAPSIVPDGDHELFRWSIKVIKD